jgi:Carboxypeptidase regulatory-like domain
MLWSAGQCIAWGPHPEITQAAVDTLGSDAPIARELGPELKRLRDYCWMADWRRQLHREAGAWFYTDDYLLFPRMTTHRDHLCPEVKQTYEPYFRRALQALRTETPVNAARWIGSIIHFTEDTGSPPHAAEIRGDVHSKMENWVDAKAIKIDGYHPQSLGATDDEAVAGFLRRMDGLIAFSKERAERAKPFVLAGDRPATEPIVLESALECSRIVADLLCTLGKLAEQPAGDGAALQGTITSIAAPGLEKVAAKVVLVGTPFSTIADSEGHYAFHGLPTGTYQLASWRPGSAVTTASAAVAAHQTALLNLALSAEATPGNLVRNSAFDLIWLGSAQPDDWYPVKSRIDGPHWEGELVPLENGKTYRLEVLWQEEAAGQVLVRLRKSADFSQLPTESKPLAAGETKLEFLSEGGFAQVLIYCTDAPSKLIKHVALSAVQ